MKTNNNDYTKEEDFMMWELHEIRKKIVGKGTNADEINKTAEKILTEYGMLHLMVKNEKTLEKD